MFIHTEIHKAGRQTDRQRGSEDSNCFVVFFFGLPHLPRTRHRRVQSRSRFFFCSCFRKRSKRQRKTEKTERGGGGAVLACYRFESWWPLMKCTYASRFGKHLSLYSRKALSVSVSIEKLRRERGRGFAPSVFSLSETRPLSVWLSVSVWGHVWICTVRGGDGSLQVYVHRLSVCVVFMSRTRNEGFLKEWRAACDAASPGRERRLSVWTRFFFLSASFFLPLFLSRSSVSVSPPVFPMHLLPDNLHRRRITGQTEKEEKSLKEGNLASVITRSSPASCPLYICTSLCVYLSSRFSGFVWSCRGLKKKNSFLHRHSTCSLPPFPGLILLRVFSGGG